MTFWNAVYMLLLAPLELIFEVVYQYAYSWLYNPGKAIIVLSLTINILVLPLYNRADAMQEAQREIEERLQKGVSHIRKTFRGDERTMMLQTYYRQNQYSPVSALRGAASLLLEIPFFIAAYRFLSELDLLNRASFGPIADLSKPDGLLIVGSMTINILPILMTAINLISCAIFTRKAPVKTKVQLYGMAAFFLVFLYQSPAGLVFYWTLNNAFSLGKTIVNKLKNPKLAVEGLMCVAGIGSLGIGIGKIIKGNFQAFALFLGVGLLLCIPVLRLFYGDKKEKTNVTVAQSSANPRLFFCGAVFLSILIGGVIPSAVISASPQEFINLYSYLHPVWYIVAALLTSLGTFALWFGVFYCLASLNAKAVFDKIIVLACGVAVVNYLFFGTNLGILSSALQYENGLSFTVLQKVLNLLTLTGVCIALLWLQKKVNHWFSHILRIGVLALCCMTVINTSVILKSIAAVDKTEAVSTSEISVTLSKTENNVVIIMLDRAMGAYIPYLMTENTTLQQTYDGFTYYSNVVSFGGHTNFATPSLFGGYEYTPVEINRRSDESIAEKHNEALKVLPVLFDTAGFEVTVCDMPYAGYQWTPDMSIYDDYPEIQTYITTGAFSADVEQEKQSEGAMRNFFCFGVMKVLPVMLQESLYEYGNYRSAGYEGIQIRTTASTAYAIDSDFCDSFGVLQNLSSMTSVSGEGNGAFFILQNDSTHESILFQEPDYVLSEVIDNIAYDEENQDRFTVNGTTLQVKSIDEYGAYETNMAALLAVGEWLDYLREMGVYDNTRIILVSDHGYGYNQLEELLLDETALENAYDNRLGDAEFYYPLLMVKDFNSTGFTISEEFMTNADVPTLAVTGVIENPENPFTGNCINNEEKTAHEQLIIASSEFSIYTNNENQFHAARWYAVHDNIWNKENWTLVAEEAVLPE